MDLNVMSDGLGWMLQCVTQIPTSCLRLAPPKLLEMLVADCSKLSKHLRICVPLKRTTLSKVMHPSLRQLVFEVW